MTDPRGIVVLAIGVAFQTGCSEHASTGPSDAPSEVVSIQASAGSLPDLSGEWSWSSEEQLTIPDAIAGPVFGIEPEGPTTRARCHNSGMMTLNQAGADFAGSSVRTAHQCVTRGGQVFQGPAAFAPVPIVDGTVQGASARWLEDGIVVDCRHQAVISVDQGGVAIALEGGGTCIVPGHPKSDVPLDPPPAGTDKVLHFEATRP